ncbi:MAG: endonuclease III [Treponema sp.]|jgi:endonuclease-3|nr:endonuclease III [Treponema sp.]
MTNADWDAVISALEAWRDSLKAQNQTVTTVPSVTTVAERYKQDPWAVLASTILSLRTKDAVTLLASRALLEKAPTPAALLPIPEDEVARLIYPAGFYRTKAASLKRIAAILVDKYNGAVPADMNALLELPGVGRKTANLVLIEAFDMDGICVDTHVHRISNRRGWVSTANPDQTELVLREILPKKHWKPINALLVRYGQGICQPVSPFCSRCIITDGCEQRNVSRRR